MSASPEPKSAIVTGAASGLGRAVAVRLARDGWRLALADVNDAGLRETLIAVENAGGSGQVERLDVADPEAWREMVGRLESHWTCLDLLVNNAGVSCAGEVGKLPLENWRWIIDINLFGAIHGCDACIDWLKSNPRGGHIVNVASLAAFVPMPTMAAYNVTKAGVMSLSETLAVELRQHRIGVTVVMPGFFKTNLLQQGRFVTEQQREAAEKYMRHARATPEGIAEKIARAVARNRLYVFDPFYAWVFWRLKRFMPRTLLKILAWAYEVQFGGRKSWIKW